VLLLLLLLHLLGLHHLLLRLLLGLHHLLLRLLIGWYLSTLLRV
jgi:hypothetical protein